jgi:hypothetical protein
VALEKQRWEEQRQQLGVAKRVRMTCMARLLALTVLRVWGV